MTEEKQELMRINKYLAGLGIESRRQVDQMVLEERVMVNGKIVTEAGLKVSSDDAIKVDGKLISGQMIAKKYLILNKPKGVMTTRSDDKKRPIVYQYLHGVRELVFPVGRLDFASEGILLFTNDGELANKLAHPKYLVLKRYEVKVSGIPDSGDMKLLTKKLMEPCLKYDVPPRYQQNVKIIEKTGKNAWLEFNIYEGKNREIRNLCDMVFHSVLKLKRTRFAFLTLEGLQAGEFRELKRKEIVMLESLVAKSQRQLKKKETSGSEINKPKKAIIRKPVPKRPSSGKPLSRKRAMRKSPRR